MSYAFSDVNFIPDEIDQVRDQEARKKSAVKYMIVLFSFFLLVGLGLFAYNLYTKSRINKVIKETEEGSAKIASLSDFGASGYKLGKRLGSIKSLLEVRPYYANLINEINIQTPSDIRIDKIGSAGQTDITINGVSSKNYSPISTFQRNLQSSDSGYFIDVKLDSAKLNKDDGSVEFSFKLVLDKGKLNVKRN